MSQLGVPPSRSRRQLQAIRVADALGLGSSPRAEVRHKNALIPALVTSTGVGEESDRNLVDAAMSVALAAATDDPEQRLLDLCLASEVLAANGEIARLASTGRSFLTLSERFNDRPFLALALQSISRLLSNDRDGADLLLLQGLGLSESGDAVRDAPSPAAIRDVGLAAGIREIIAGEEPALIESVAQATAEAGDATQYQLACFELELAKYVREAATGLVVRRHAQAFRDPRLVRYLNRRKISVLFPSQLDALRQGALSQGSKVIAMPTSAGKTFLAELRIAQRIPRNGLQRAIYLAPYRLLARQVEQKLRDALRYANLTVRDLGGEFNTDPELLEEELPSVAVMTPERMDALLRMSRRKDETHEALEARKLIDSVRLVVFDEIHLVGRSGRGPRLELLLARLGAHLPEVEVFGLSAVTSSTDSLSDWLDADAIVASSRPTGSLEVMWRTDGSLAMKFGNSSYVIEGLPRASTAIESAAQLALRFRSDRFPVLIVESRRDYAESVVSRILSADPRATDRWLEQLNPEQRRRLALAAEESEASFGAEHPLVRLLPAGLAYHHAGLPANVLRLIEDATRSGAIRALGATTTVAEGADLPFQVVIVPHLNFQGASGRLERDLYLNIRGRAGRAGVSSEGLIVVLDSDSPFLRGHVESELWSEEDDMPLRGQLIEVSHGGGAVEDRAARREVESQLLAWLAEGGRAIEEPANSLAKRSFTWHTASHAERERLGLFLEDVYADMEFGGLVRAASPLSLTELGERARLAGLGSGSCLRLQRLLTEENQLLPIVDDQTRTYSNLSEDAAAAIAFTVLQTEETLEQTLWFRRLPVDGRTKGDVLRRLSSGERAWPDTNDTLFAADFRMMTEWILGRSFEELGEVAPIFERGLFSSTDPAKRAADAADFLGRLAYPASWSWSAALAMADAELPTWVRRAIEWGVPSATAVSLIETRGLSRRGAGLIASQARSDLFGEDIDALFSEWSPQDVVGLGLTRSDMDRVLQSASE